MCSIGEDDFVDEGGVHVMVPNEKIVKDTNVINEPSFQFCCKCKQAGAVFKLPFRQAECRECFLLYVRHKFRAVLGASKILPKDAKVILVFDGSAESVVLLDMLHHAQAQNTFKRLHCSATVIYIDDFYMLEQNERSYDSYKRYLEEVEVFLKRYTYFESFIVPLVNVEEVINCITNIKDIKKLQYTSQHANKKQFLLNSINSIKTLTSRQDFLKYYRIKIIDAIAKHFKSKFAFMSSTSSNLASDLLAAVALGRGGSAALDIALVDDRFPNEIKLIRPLRNLNNTEIQLYLEAQGLQALQDVCYGQETDSTTSVQNLAKSFIDNLQQNFTATVSTVFRTGDKIIVNKGVIPSFKKHDLNDADKLEMREVYCLFCNSFLDYQESTTLLAIEFSRLVSENGRSLNNIEDLNSKAGENVKSLKGKPHLKKLCHACQNIYIDCPSESILMNIKQS